MTFRRLAIAQVKPIDNRRRIAMLDQRTIRPQRARDIFWLKTETKTPAGSDWASRSPPALARACDKLMPSASKGILALRPFTDPGSKSKRRSRACRYFLLGRSSLGLS